MSDGKKELDTLIQQVKTFWKQGKLKELADLFCENAIVVAPSNRIMRGRQEIQKHYEGMQGMGNIDCEINLIDYDVAGDAAAGVTKHNAYDKDKNLVGEGSSLTYYRRINGTWMIHYDMFQQG